MAPDTDDLDRRTVLHGAAGVLVAGALAGCSGGSGDGGANDTGNQETETETTTGGNATADAGTEGTDAGTTTGTGTEPGDTTTGDGTTDGGTTGGATSDTATANESSSTNATTAMNGDMSTTSGTSETTVGTGAVDEYLSEARGYDGSIADETGSGTVEIAVGAGESGFAFEPTAVRVSRGTTVVWQWTGKGGRHNVVSAGDGPLDSGSPRTGEDVTYEETLSSPGVYRYYCNPHRSLGMKGAIVVAGE